MKIVKFGESNHYDFIESFLGEDVLELYKLRLNENYRNNFNPESKVRNINDLNDSINLAFCWADTPEGHDFWSNKHRIMYNDLNDLTNSNLL